MLERPATVIAREAIEARLRERRRASARASIAAYATKHAGAATDLDPDLEGASLDLWQPRRGDNDRAKLTRGGRDSADYA